MFTFTMSAGAVFCIGILTGIILSATALVVAAIISGRKK